MKEAGEGLSFASPGVPSSGHLSLAMLEGAANVKVRHVPYRGAAPLVTDVLGAHVPVGIVNVDIPFGHVKDGKLRVLPVTSAKRSALYPDAPTIAESGFPGFEAQGWFGLSAPAGTPEPIITKLNALANEFLREDKMKKRFEAGGYLAGGGSPQDYAAFIDAEIKKWAGVVKASGISLEYHGTAASITPAMAMCRCDTCGHGNIRCVHRSLRSSERALGDDIAHHVPRASFAIRLWYQRACEFSPKRDLRME